MVHRDQARRDTTTTVSGDGGTSPSAGSPWTGSGFMSRVAGRSIRLGGDECRPRPDRRRRLPGCRESAAEGEHRRPQAYPHPTVLAACALLGVDEVYTMGARRPSPASPTASPTGRMSASRSAWSRGRQYLSPQPEAPAQRPHVSIDAEPARPRSPCSPTQRRPQFVAADLINGRARPAGASVLVTDSPELADAVSDRGRAPGGGDQAQRSRVCEALRGPAVGHRAGRRHRARPGGRQRLCRRAPGSP